MTNELHEEIDKLRMQLVACDCISLCNTPKTLEDILDNLHSDYYCAAVRGVIDAVKREIKHREEAEFYKQEVERLKQGDFTPEEFQHLCHKFQDADLECFGKGCEDYQRKLFGKCWKDVETERLRAWIRELRDDKENGVWLRVQAAKVIGEMDAL